MQLDSIRSLGRRSAVLTTASCLSLAGLLAVGLVLASAGGGPQEPVEATSTPSASASGDAGTSGSGDDNTAVAVNTRDGSEVYALRLKVVIVRGDTVDATNAAVAAASCTDCQTVAIALEGVLITGDAEVIAPVNLALALNNGCDGCQTLAYAYQKVQTTDGMVRITGEGRQRIGELRRQLNALRTAGLGIEEIRQRVSEIAAAFAEVLDTQVVAVGPSSGAQVSSTQPAQEPSPSASGTPSPEPAGSPAEEATPTSTTSDDASPSASPSPSPSPSPSSSPSASPSPASTTTP